MASGIKEGLITYQTLNNQKRQERQFNALHGVSGYDESDNPIYTAEEEQKRSYQNKLIKNQAEQYDPNSESSQRASGLLREATGKDYGDMSASEIKEYAPILNQSQKGDVATEMARDRIAKQKESRDLKDSEGLNKRFGLLQADLDANKSRGGNMAKNQSRVDNADRLITLGHDSGGNIRNLDSREMEELAIGLQSMLSPGGTGSVSQVEALVPHTNVGKFNSVKEWLINDPQGAGQQKFVEKMMHTVEREREVALNQVRAAQSSRLGAYGDLYKKDPDRYKRILTNYQFTPETIDENGQYVAQKLAPGLLNKSEDDAKDPKIAEWAKQHSMDYGQAAAIIEKRRAGK